MAATHRHAHDAGDDRAHGTGGHDGHSGGHEHGGGHAHTGGDGHSHGVNPDADERYLWLMSVVATFLPSNLMIGFPFEGSGVPVV